MKKNSIIILVILAMGACSTQSNKNAKQKEDKNLLNIQSTWVLKSMSGKIYKKQDTMHPEIIINAIEKQFNGNDGCNNIFGSITKLNKEEISFGEISSTMMACENMEMTYEYTQQLRKVRKYEMDGNILILKDKAGNTILTFSIAEKTDL